MNLRSLRKKQMLELCNSLLVDYVNCLTENELKIINYIFNNLDQIEALHTVEPTLLPIVSKIWKLELASDNYRVISWNKYFYPTKNDVVTFATLSRKDDIISFCNASSGIEYKITFDSLIGALQEDGATLIENIEKQNEYTIGTIGGKAINSYNGATKFITPMQLIRLKKANYASKYNELILDSRRITKIGAYEKKLKKSTYVKLIKL